MCKYCTYGFWHSFDWTFMECHSTVYRKLLVKIQFTHWSNDIQFGKSISGYLHSSGSQVCTSIVINWSLHSTNYPEGTSKNGWKFMPIQFSNHLSNRNNSLKFTTSTKLRNIYYGHPFVFLLIQLYTIHLDELC